MTALASPYHAGYRELRHTQEAARQHSMTPERSLQQRMDALENANKIRTARAKLKRDIKAGRETAYGHLMAPPEFIKTMKVWDLVLAQPKFGRVKTNKIMVNCRISPSKTVGGLSERQRLELASFVHVRF